MDTEHVRRRAFEKREPEGRPEGQDRRWYEAERELAEDDDLPQTSSPSHHSATTIPGDEKASSDAISSEGGPGSFKPGELASENK
ncbi:MULTISPECIES: DUF2934 domain-containing protein [unclassified Rhizobium]|uniref:DUF2934 domain-containing protein n=1 Tax=unclassified Rhizobium TaxID=2613769 RepID=UPI00146E7C6E|nr:MULTISPECIES: DUF2934 domain-containing protein [unclassified Rhizobium]MBD9448603.1 DUF2934 domain-containing protein [Rhizobium sp. RHZ01]MBD9454728.1 DUF2934 domain-containing protein [Rhizobium sp. RHZ02]NMN70881.1 Protein of unknown function (DUF2934) [Rhizobium sp. 57MFTsu3.2]